MYFLPASTHRRRNLKTQQSLVILDFCLVKPRSGKSHNYRDPIVFENLRFQIFFPHEYERRTSSDSSGLKSVSKKIRFRDGLACTVVRPNRRNKPPFSKFLRRYVDGALVLYVYIFQTKHSHVRKVGILLYFRLTLINVCVPVLFVVKIKNCQTR